MQAAGSLKKKRRRNLAKVTGLGALGYQESNDAFDIQQLYSGGGGGGAIWEDQADGSSTRSGSITRPTRAPYPPTGNDPEWGATRQSSATGSTSSYIPSGYPPPAEPGSSKAERPCLLSKNAVSRLKQVCIVGALVWALPWRYDAKTRRVERWSPGLHRVWSAIWWAFAVQNTVLLGYQFYSFFARVQLDNGSYRPVFMNSFCVFWYLYSISLNTTMHMYRDKFRIYINTLLAFNEKNVERYVLTLDELGDHGQAILKCAVPANFIQLCLSCTLYLFMPYQPWYLTSYIYSPDNPKWWLIPGALQEWVMAGQTVAVFCLLAWITVSHGNCVEFWLMEAHQGNDTGYTIDSLRESHTAIELYRSLQVLTGLLNECISPLAFPIMKMINWTAVVSCGYVLIRSMNQKFIDEFPAIMTYPFGVIVCGSCGYGMLQISAEMFDIATSFLNSWSQTRHKNLRRIMTSCSILRIYVGRFYFVTISTTITYFQKTFDYIIDCIVTFP
ncbi:uncharacterized protein LOC118438390 [Folsomia candida]|uniref:Gustatory receptor n=1 Tax=Folsomia candida TaxID=158441 RepID=A0A226DGC8_FOLCA|nr:uncharacterized protein LOC118438390 [Folsomia candida]OXA44190.1 hypothetical protein Fcan01_21095 [Folsomia candida]